MKNTKSRRIGKRKSIFILLPLTFFPFSASFVTELVSYVSAHTTNSITLSSLSTPPYCAVCSRFSMHILSLCRTDLFSSPAHKFRSPIYNSANKRARLESIFTFQFICDLIKIDWCEWETGQSVYVHALYLIYTTFSPTHSRNSRIVFPIPPRKYFSSPIPQVERTNIPIIFTRQKGLLCCSYARLSHLNTNFGAHSSLLGADERTSTKIFGAIFFIPP